MRVAYRPRIWPQAAAWGTEAAPGAAVWGPRRPADMRAPRAQAPGRCHAVPAPEPALRCTSTGPEPVHVCAALNGRASSSARGLLEVAPAAYSAICATRGRSPADLSEKLLLCYLLRGSDAYFVWHAENRVRWGEPVDLAYQRKRGPRKRAAVSGWAVSKTAGIRYAPAVGHSPILVEPRSHTHPLRPPHPPDFFLSPFCLSQQCEQSFLRGSARRIPLPLYPCTA